MKLTVNRKLFVSHLELAARAVEKKNTIPVLRNVRIEAWDVNFMTMSGTDLELSILTAIPADVSEAGKTTAPAVPLLKAARSFTAETVTIDADDKTLTLSAGRASAAFEVMSIESYPEMIPVMPDTLASIPVPAFAEAVSRVLYAISQEENRFTLNAAKLEWNGHFRLIATDGHRMSIVDRPETATPHDLAVLLPKRFMVEVSRLKGTLEFSQSDDFVFARVGNVAVIDRKLKRQGKGDEREDANFPDYHRVIPKDVEREGTVNPQELAAVLKRALPFACERSRAVRLHFAEGELAVTGGTFRETLPLRYTGEAFSFAVNGQYLTEFLRTAPDGDLALQFNSIGSSGNAAIMMTPAAGGYRHLLMGMRG